MAERFKGVLSLSGKKPKEERRRDYPISREVLYEFPGLVSYHVSAKALRVQSKHLQGTYLQLGHGVSGGSVTIYVSGTSQLARLRGQIISAKLMVKEKIFQDGRTVVYCDLEVVPKGVATHMLLIAKDAKALREMNITHKQAVHGGYVVIAEK